MKECDVCREMAPLKCDRHAILNPAGELETATPELQNATVIAIHWHDKRTADYGPDASMIRDALHDIGVLIKYGATESTIENMFGETVCDWSLYTTAEIDPGRWAE